MIPGSANPLLLKSAAAAGGYQVQRSLRFNSSDSAYLSRTPAVAGNRKTWTWAGWIKRNKLGTAQQFLTCSASGYSGNWSILGFDSSDKLVVYFGLGSNPDLGTTAVYRDPSAWMHVLINCDTTQATAANRGAIYVNGAKITAFDFETYRTQNFDTDFNTTSAHDLGRQSIGYYYCDLMLADIHFIDGQQLTPSSFTEVSATTGQLIPKAYTGTFGTNGFWLKFSDNSAATAAALGNDYSGNNNDWTPNNLSVTAGAGNDSLVDTPTSNGTDTGVGGEVRGNYCTWNPLRLGPSASLANGNLDWSKAAGSNYGLATGTISLPISGKWYWEIVPTSNPNPASGFSWYTGVSETSSASTNYLEQTGVSCGYIATGSIAYNGGSAAFGSTFTTNDVIGVAVDMDNGAIYFAKNGTWQNSGVPTSGASKTGAARTNLSGASLYPSCASNDSTYAFSATANFGQRAFAYTAPSGFKALCDTNLGAPVVAKPNTVMDVVLYSGNNSTQSITSLAFNPDMVWSKCRNVGRSHRLSDVIRGSNVDLYTDTTASDNFYGSGSITAFTANGFNLDNSASSQYNTSGETYVSWCWDAGTSTVSNTAGSITSQVRANATAGFSIATLTTQSSGTGTFGHGLNAAPAFYIVKTRGISSNWWCYHSSLSTSQSSAIALNLTNATVGSTSLWNNTAPTSTVISLGSDWAGSLTLVAYAFAPVVGYSSMGSYVGNASADGPMVYLGFRPRFVIIKCSSTSNSYTNWDINDSARNTYNAADNTLCANLSDQENSGNIGGQPLDFLANGFKIRQATSSSKNLSGQTYIYAAFAENPFQYARAR